MKDTAILLFVFNRPEHTKKVLEGLKQNKIKDLYVFSDGPRNPNDEININKVRKMIDNVDWCNIISEYRETNIGLANSVIYGVSKVFSLGYEKVIVLEDDCAPKESFINFMEKSFEFYNDINEVMHISGFGLPIKKYTDKDVYLTPYPCSWGWGTWKKYWFNCDFDQYENYKKLLSDINEVKKFNFSGEAFSEFLNMQLQKKVNSWLIRWYFYIYSQDGRCVWPYQSLIQNNGFDGSGVHKNKFDRFNQHSKENLALNNIKFEDNLDYNKKIIREFRRFFMGKKLKERIKTTIYLTTGLFVGK